MKRWIGVLLTCAWILWAETTTVTTRVTQHHAPMAALETQAACESRLEAIVEEVGKTHTKMPYNVGVIAKNNKTMIMFRCWPDTIDPRAK
jgi:hypothetical protein